ncbi:MAG: carbon dioxide-concentrating mechanism protein CcmK [Chroococcales cyanobacterium]
MPMAVGVVETLGFPAVLAAADAMVKAARVTVVFCDKSESGRFMVCIRGPVSEVKRALPMGVEAGENTYGGQVITHYIVPNPPENLEAILPIDYTEESEPFRL